MSDPGEFETSASYVNAIARALKKLGQFDAVIARAAPRTAQMLRAPTSLSWWPSEEAFGMTRAIAEVGGPELVQRVGHLAVFESLSAIVRPLVSVLLALSGPSPATLLARFGQVTQAAVKNVNFGWTPSSPTSGEMVITYPRAVPAEYVAFWLGAFDFIWEATKKTGVVQAKHDGARLQFTLRWS